jgi:hypothetical protein
MVMKDDTAPSKPHVLKQSGEATYPVCFKNDTHLKDGFVEVKFKPVSGKEDQAGGIVWRLKGSRHEHRQAARQRGDFRGHGRFVFRCDAQAHLRLVRGRLS